MHYRESKAIFKTQTQWVIKETSPKRSEIFSTNYIYSSPTGQYGRHFARRQFQMHFIE